MTDNLALWEKLGKTDPAHTKGFKRGGGFSGTAIKPMWSYKRMTEEFGPCGIGWGVGEPSFQVVPGPEGEILVYCTASIWYGADKATVYGVGGDKAVGKNKYGLQTDDEAFKKAFTDAITNALKLIGVGADVHMGLFDDSKYVNTMREEFAGDERSQSKPADDPKPISAAANENGYWSKHATTAVSRPIRSATRRVTSTIRGQRPCCVGSGLGSARTSARCRTRGSPRPPHGWSSPRGPTNAPIASALIHVSAETITASGRKRA